MRRSARALAALAVAATAMTTVPAAAAAPAPRDAGAGGAAADLFRNAGSARATAAQLRVDPSAQDAVPGVLLVTTSGRSATDRLPAAAAKAVRGARAQGLSARVARVAVAAGQERSAAAALQAQPGVIAVEQARYRRLLAVPDDRLFEQQWAHQVTDAPRAWDVTTGAPTVKVAVLDNGVDGRHPDLAPNITEQRSFQGGVATQQAVDSDNRVCADEGRDHGTHVAGIVGAQGNDGFGVVGVAWDVSLLDYAVFNESRFGCGASDADVIAAIDAAAAANADVVNMSLGGASTACSTAFQAVIDDARAAGTVVVAASGNSEQQAPGETSVPASCNGVISVGSVGIEANHAPYSTANAYVDIAAPGGDKSRFASEGILSTVGEGGHDWFEGTSMASPYVAGVAALLRSRVPSLTADQVEGLLEAGAVDKGPVGRDEQYGVGVVNAGRSLELAAQGARPQPDVDPLFPVGGDGGDIAPPPTEAPQVYRVSAGTGTTNPVPQAVAMSRATFEDDSAAHAVLARRDVFADALAGSSLGMGAGPLLFAAQTGPLLPATRDELLRTLVPNSRVYLLGGTLALPSSLETELRGLGFQPVRLAGNNREETAVAISSEVASRRVQLEREDQGVVMLAKAGDWPDAVAAGSLGAYYGIPILLTPTTTLARPTADKLRALRDSGAIAGVIVLGGPAAINEATYAAAASAAGGAARVFGQDRYETAIEIAKLFENVLADAGTLPRCVIAVNLVRGDGWAHVLSASAPAGAFGCVMVPVQNAAGDALPSVTEEYVRGFGIDGVLAGDVDLIKSAVGSRLEELLQP